MFSPYISERVMEGLKKNSSEKVHEGTTYRKICLSTSRPRVLFNSLGLFANNGLFYLDKKGYSSTRDESYAEIISLCAAYPMGNKYFVDSSSKLPIEIGDFCQYRVVGYGHVPLFFFHELRWLHTSICKDQRNMQRKLQAVWFKSHD
jgi:hypothetical protein